MDKLMRDFIGDGEVFYAFSAEIKMSPEQVVLKLTNGKKSTLYVLSPLHMKRLMLVLQAHVEFYEKNVGELKTDLAKPIVSPMQLKEDK